MVCLSWRIKNYYHYKVLSVIALFLRLFARLQLKNLFCRSLNGWIHIELFYIGQYLNFSGQCVSALCLIHLPIPVSLLPVCFGSPYAYASFYCWALSLCLKLSANLHLSSHLQVQAHRSMSVFLRLCFTWWLYLFTAKFRPSARSTFFFCLSNTAPFL